MLLDLLTAAPTLAPEPGTATERVAAATLDVLPLLDVVGIALFALSGALAAARERQTLVTFAFFALVTGVGGGTVHDLLIDAPVFWVASPWVSLTCFAMALAVWVTPERWWVDAEGRSSALDWFDAAGLAAYAVFGSFKALSFGVHPFVAALMGVITACVGGILRDVLAGRPSIILRPELYVTAAALSAGLFVALHTGLGVWWPSAALVAALSGFALRAAAITRGVALPSYRGR